MQRHLRPPLPARADAAAAAAGLHRKPARRRMRRRLPAATHLATKNSRRPRSRGTAAGRRCLHGIDSPAGQPRGRRAAPRTADASRWLRQLQSIVPMAGQRNGQTDFRRSTFRSKMASTSSEATRMEPETVGDRFRSTKRARRNRDGAEAGRRSAQVRHAAAIAQ